MDDKGLLGAIAHVNSIWSIAAFAIAAIVAVLKLALASPTAARGGERPHRRRWAIRSCGRASSSSA